MQSQTIMSSNIECVGYVAGGTLYIRFKSGVAYTYDRVPAAVYQGLISAESAGHFFHQNIKGKFEYSKLSYDPFKSLADAPIAA